MARDNKKKRGSPPARTPESREKQLIDLAVELAEKQLKAGTATAQVIAHFLKLGSTQAALEKEKMENETALLLAKVDSLKSQKKVEELYAQALNAMRNYSGMSDNDD